MGTVLIKEKNISILYADLLRPQQVAQQINDKLNNALISITTPKKQSKQKKFSSDLNIYCWKKFKVRPNTKSKNPEKTNPQYCIYDKLNNNYGYTIQWVDFLVTHIKGQNMSLDFSTD